MYVCESVCAMYASCGHQLALGGSDRDGGLTSEFSSTLCNATLSAGGTRLQERNTAIVT